MRHLAWVVAAGLFVVLAAPTFASDRDIDSAVDTYLSSAETDAALVGGPGSAGYDAGFWIRGGDFSLRINLTLQARYEYFDFDYENGYEPDPGGDLSGFSLPRAILKFSGTAPCNFRYYVELDFGHFGREDAEGESGSNLGIDWDQSYNYDNTREAWIEWGCSQGTLNIRMGQIALPTTRQLLTPPELQQFVDISMASASVGLEMPGYTDRNRDHGLLLHGVFGCTGEFQYMLSITNGDGGDSIRNVLDPRTSDNLAYGARLNWAFLEPIGYEEGALGQDTCTWYGELGLWGFFYADRTDQPHRHHDDLLAVGVDLALGRGGFSFTGAFTYMALVDEDDGDDVDGMIWLAQAGYLFPDTSWEIAARWSHHVWEPEDNDWESTFDAFAFAVNYYINGHGNKLTVDVSLFTPGDDGGGMWDVYSGYGFGSDDPDDTGMLVRFQWQLAL